MTKYKSELTQLLNDIEEACVKVEDGQMSCVEIIEFLDDIYNRLNDCRVEIEEHVRDLHSAIDEVQEYVYEMGI